MTSDYTLSAAVGAVLPALRFFQYLDEDVYSIGDNILVASGSVAGGDLELLTVHPTIHAGVSQAGDSQATGWGADIWPDLRSALNPGGYDATPLGSVSDLPWIADPYYGLARGPADITSCIERQIAGAFPLLVLLVMNLKGTVLHLMR